MANILSGALKALGGLGAGAVQGFIGGSSSGGSSPTSFEVLKNNAAHAPEKSLVGTTQSKIGSETPVREPKLDSREFQAEKINTNSDDIISGLDRIHYSIVSDLNTVNKNVIASNKYNVDMFKKQDGKFNKIDDVFRNIERRETDLQKQIDKLNGRLHEKKETKAAYEDRSDRSLIDETKKDDKKSPIDDAIKTAEHITEGVGAGMIGSALLRSAAFVTGLGVAGGFVTAVGLAAILETWSKNHMEAPPDVNSKDFFEKMYGKGWIADIFTWNQQQRREEDKAGVWGSNRRPTPTVPQTKVPSSLAGALTNDFFSKTWDAFRKMGNEGVDGRNPSPKGPSSLGGGLSNDFSKAWDAFRKMGNEGVGTIPSPKGPHVEIGKPSINDSSGKPSLAIGAFLPNLLNKMGFGQTSSSPDTSVPFVTGQQMYGPPDMPKDTSISPKDLIDLMSAITNREDVGGGLPGSSGMYVPGTGTTFRTGSRGGSYQGYPSDYKGQSSGGYQGSSPGSYKGNLSDLKAGTERFFVNQGHLQGVDDSLVKLIKEASKDLPAGYRVEMVSGKDARSTGTTNHPGGIAIDIQIYVDIGKALKNSCFDSDFYLYVMMYQSVNESGKILYPNIKYIWGGTWISSAAGYGDRMHYQLVAPWVRNSSPGMNNYDAEKVAKGQFSSIGMSPDELSQYKAKIHGEAIDDYKGGTTARTPTSAPSSKGSMLFLHGMQSRYGNKSPQEIEDDARKYASSKGYNLEVINVSGDNKEAQLAAARDRIQKGGISSVLGFSAGGYTTQQLQKEFPNLNYESVGAPGVPWDQTKSGISHMDQVEGLMKNVPAIKSDATPRITGKPFEVSPTMKSGLTLAEFAGRISKDQIAKLPKSVQDKLNASGTSTITPEEMYQIKKNTPELWNMIPEAQRKEYEPKLEGGKGPGAIGSVLAPIAKVIRGMFGTKEETPSFSPSRDDDFRPSGGGASFESGSGMSNKDFISQASGRSISKGQLSGMEGFKSEDFDNFKSKGKGMLDRSRFVHELDKVVASPMGPMTLREKLMRLSLGENRDPVANKAVMEETMNRAAVRKVSLEEATKIHGLEPGGYSAGFYRGPIEPWMQKMTDANLRDVLGGSNVVKGATDNSSGDLALREGSGNEFTHVVNYGGSGVTGTGGVESFWTRNSERQAYQELMAEKKLEGDPDLLQYLTPEEREKFPMSNAMQRQRYGEIYDPALDKGMDKYVGSSKIDPTYGLKQPRRNRPSVIGDITDGKLMEGTPPASDLHKDKGPCSRSICFR